MRELKWYHSFEIEPGIRTPGYDWDSLWGPIRSELDKIDFKGKKVLDVGTWDGMWAFEAEKRGASYVVACDHLPVRPAFNKTGLETFEFAKKHLRSRVEFEHLSIYDLSSLNQVFDIVLCFGVAYHLRYPTYALAQCRKVLAPQGLLLMETAILLDDDSTKIELDYKKIYPTDPSTWCAHSKGAMDISLSSSYLSPQTFSVLCRQDEERKIGRGYWASTAVSGKIPRHVFPYPRLEEFFSP
jgi:tRNA (mo5U34)-methyltransferase